jgi:hypothetical protein
VKRVRKATAFRGRTDKTVLPYKSPEQTNLENVPGEHFQRVNVKIDFRDAWCYPLATSATAIRNGAIPLASFSTTGSLR